MIVRFKEGTSPQARAVGSSRHGATIARTDSFVDGLAFLDVAPADLAGVLSALRNDPDVLYAEPNYRITFATDLPNDPQLSGQWGLPAIRAYEAWNSWTGVDAADFRVAVIDSGVAYDHPDLVANIWTNPLEQPGDANGDYCPGVCGIDDDGDGIVDEWPLVGGTGPGLSTYGDDDENGYVDDFHGFDFARFKVLNPGEQPYNNDNDPYPEPGDGRHGTLAAGILGARTNNALGVAGVAWRCKIVALKISDPDGDSYVLDAVEAIDYCIRTGIRVSNNSYKFDAYSQCMYDKIAAARDHGHLFIAAVGNEGRNVDIQPAYPACYNLSNIIAVAASDLSDRLWVGAIKGGSNYGSTCVDLAAPGVDILTTSWSANPTTYFYETITGTSVAAPFVTGTAVLMMGKNPSWSSQFVRNRILTTTRFVPALDCKTATGGILNASAALGDCNNNAVLDATDIANHTSNDCNNNGIPDECDYDCNGNGIPESCEGGFPPLIRACCFTDNRCHDCVNLTPCECVARGGIVGPALQSCHNYDCLAGPD